MKQLILSLFLLIGLNAWAASKGNPANLKSQVETSKASKKAPKEAPLNLNLSRDQLRAIMAETDAVNAAEAIKKSRYLEPKEFAEIVRSNGGKNAGEVFISLDMKDPTVIALAAATSLGLIVFKNDEEIMDYVQEHKSQIPQGVEDFGYFIGSRQGNASIMAGSYFLGVVLKNNELKKVGIISVASGVATALVTEAFKRTYGRSRPREGVGAYEFYGEGKSFFSGHTSSIFSLATVFSEVYGDEYPVVPYLAYGLATVTAYSRMSANAHWASDVLAGAIAGVLITKIVYHFMDKKFTDSKGNRYLSFYPSYDKERKSINVTVNYVPKSWR